MAVEPERRLRELAERAAGDAPVSVRVVDGVADELPFGDATFDAAVASLTLCSVASVEAVLAELHRVLRPGGELRFVEHVGSPRRAIRAIQQAADATSGRGSREAATSGATPAG